MVQHHVFSVDRDIDIPKDVFFTSEELAESEKVLTDLGCEHAWFPSTTTTTAQSNGQPHPCHLHYRSFLPEKRERPQPKAVVIFMHGLQSHCGVSFSLSSGRKTNMALLADEWVQKRGYALYAFDMIGHGFSEGKRFFLPSPKALISDYINFVKMVASKHTDDDASQPLPLFLTGESLGGNLTLHVARHFQDHPLEAAKTGFCGVVLFSPAIIPDSYAHCMYPYVYCFIKYIIAPFVPHGRPPSCIPHPVNASRIWRDPEVLKLATDRDRPINRVFGGTGLHPHFCSIQTLMETMISVRTSAIPGMNVAFCLVHGAQDLAVPVTGSEFLRDHVATSSEDFAYRIYDNALHDLLADPVAAEVMQFSSDWMQQRIQKLTS